MPAHKSIADTSSHCLYIALPAVCPTSGRRCSHCSQCLGSLEAKRPPEVQTIFTITADIVCMLSHKMIDTVNEQCHSCSDHVILVHLCLIGSFIRSGHCKQQSVHANFCALTA